MDETLQFKKEQRRMVELLVQKELLSLTQQAAINVTDSMKTGKYVVPDVGRVARKVIAIVKEHSL